jgi:hypothetical protein
MRKHNSENQLLIKINNKMLQTAKVRVSEIRGTSNAEVFNLVLRQEIPKPVESSELSFFLPKVIGEQLEKRVAFRTVDQEFMDEHTIFESEEDNICDFEDAIGMPCKIVIEETHEQRTWENADGSLGEQEPKINPQTSEVLTKGGLPIYRNSRLTLNMEEADVFIMHDKVSATKTVNIAATQALNS